MATSDHLSQQFWGPGGFMFHISPVTARESIAKHGLIPRKDPNHPDGYQPDPEGAKKMFYANEGSFLSEEPHYVGDDFDIYAVDTSYLPALKDDASMLDRIRKAVYVPGSIGPERVHLLDPEQRKAVTKDLELHSWKNPFKKHD